MSKTAPSDIDILTLAGGFPSADPDAWMALVDKSLGGKPYEKLTSKSYDGLAIKPLYTRAEDGGADPGIPGAAPYLRGSTALGNALGGWDTRSLSSHPDPVEANRQILEDLEKGATSIWLKLDPTGQTGTIIKSKADMAALLENVYLDLAPVILDPGGPSLPPAAYLMSVLEDRGVGTDAFAGNFGADPLATLAVTGKVIVPMDTLLGRMADLAVHTARTYANAKALNIKTLAYHNAGCSEAEELAVAMATAVAYLRAMTAAGLSINDSCRQIAFTFTCDTDVFLTMAKLRAARRLWARVAEASGAAAGNLTAPVNTVTAPRMMSRRDPWVNILRTTAACFAAGTGGADAITVLPFESAIGLPTGFGRRIARNTQLVLQEESSINRVVDPAGGSWMVESLTGQLAETAWSLFQDIEKRGGMAAALSDGTLAKRIAETEVARARNIATRRDALTGVSEFPDINEKPVKVDSPDIDALVAAADKRAANAKGKADALPGHGAGSLTAALIKAAKKDASAATIAAALKGTPMELTPLAQHRLAEDFEALRDASDTWAVDYGSRPKVFLANVGRVADFTARATFAKNLFEAGGVEAVAGAGGNDPAVIAGDFTSSGAHAAIICSTDDIYAETAADLAKALKDGGAAAVYIAGRANEHEQTWRDAGVDDFIYIGCDVLAVLKALHARLGVSS